ncbi:retron Ec67 family RNA-directed DNA polymerase/endonuclease [Jeotgalicoccus huakuii]|nr:retron Ec67 family RNA-directed DNA polymerase/endonuclease [Jeotgalicoccus huakuii]
MNKINKVKSRNELADYLNIPRSYLSYILYKRKTENLYSYFEIPKKNGGTRKICSPKPELKSIQRRISKEFYDIKKQQNNYSSFGFEIGKDIYKNAMKHTNKRFVLNIDIEDFFESFHFGRVRGFFNKNKNFQLPIDVATILAQLTCYNGYLPQGAPTSPIITNFICEILDYRIRKTAKKYRLHYTRYADDMTFSTNDRKFKDNYLTFYQEISKEIENAGFKINDSKSRLQDKDSRQIVTGLIVNKKINVPRDYYKKTRSMAYSLYKKGYFEIDGKTGNVNQLQGRLAFINQSVKENNIKNKDFPDIYKMKGKEKEYKKFLFYKYFFANSIPLIITEGKTDVLYIKAALKSMYKEYPRLVEKGTGDTFNFKISFLNKTRTLKYFLGIGNDGGTAFKNVYAHYTDLNYLKFFKDICKKKAENPVILIFDNELYGSNDKPINQFIKRFKIKSEKENLQNNLHLFLVENLHLLLTPPIHNNSSEIEDLFDSEVLETVIDGKTFWREDKIDRTQHYGKPEFSRYISSNFKNIDFKQFKPLLDKIDSIIADYSINLTTDQHNFNS